MRVTFSVTPTGLADAIRDKVSDVSISGIGADGASEYEIADVSVVEVDGVFTVEVEVERVEGKFASKDEVYELIVAELDSIDDIELEVS